MKNPSLHNHDSADYLKRENAPDLGYVYSPPEKKGKDFPVVVFFGGFRSDMDGTKALYLEQACRDRGQGFVRFDYSGHGSSEGAFTDGSIGQWFDDALAVIDHLASGQKLILVGSSMGGWIAFLVALDRPDQVAGVVGIAAAPDFTRSMYEEEFNEAQRKALNEQGQVELPNEYSDEPYIITKRLINDGADHCLLDRPALNFKMPVRLIQGMKDTSVPWQTAHRIKNAAPQSDIEIYLVENGDHRLSGPEELALIDREVSALAGF